MVTLRSFIGIWLSVMMAVTVLTITILPSLRNGKDGVATIESTSHFSVHWLGFVPGYKDTYPDYYICINDLKDNVLQMHIAMKLENWENSSYCFSVEPYGTPPSGWTLDTLRLGNISIDQTVTFTYSNITRSKPLAIPNGLLTESVGLVVRAYRDLGYSDLYSEDSFSVTYHFIDRTSSVWTQLDYDNFDQGSSDWWSYYDGTIELYGKYRSWPGSLRANSYYHYIWHNYYYGYFARYIDINSSYTEAYLVFSMYLDGASTYTGDIYLGDQLYFRLDTYPQPMGVWVQCAIPLPVNQTTSILITIYGGWGWSYLDDAYILTR